jgi:hypothetical protein
MQTNQYRDLLYYAPSNIQQSIFDDYSDLLITGSPGEGTLHSDLSTLLPASTRGEQSRSDIIWKVNRKTKYSATKRAVNDLLDEQPIPRIKDVSANESTDLYRFSCECQLLPEDSNSNENERIELIGKEEDILFRGSVELESWSSRYENPEGLDDRIPYPLEGLVKVQEFKNKISRHEEKQEVIEEAECNVEFVLICESEADEYKEWVNRKTLIRKYDHNR